MDVSANATSSRYDVSNCTTCGQQMSTENFRLVAFLTLAIIGIIVNSLVGYILLVRDSLRKSNFMLFAACISISDIVSSFVVLVLIVMRSIGLQYTKTLCFPVYSLSVTAFGSSTMYGLLISLERLSAVSGKALKKIFHKKKKILAAVTPPCCVILVTMTVISVYPTTGNYYFCEVGFMFTKGNGLIPVVLAAQIFVTLPVLVVAILYAVTKVRLKQHLAKIYSIDTGLELSPRRKMSSTERTMLSNTTQHKNDNLASGNKKDGNSRIVKEMDSGISHSSTVTYMDQRADVTLITKKKGTKIYPFNIKVGNDKLIPEMSTNEVTKNVQSQTTCIYKQNFVKQQFNNYFKGINTSTGNTDKVLSTNINPLPSVTNDANSERPGTRNRDKKLHGAMKTMTLIQLLMLFAYVPNAIVEILNLFIYVPSFIQPITRLITVSHPIINPILYVLRIPELRAELICRARHMY